MLMVGLLRIFKIFPTLNDNISITSILGIIGVVAGSFHYKIKKERLENGLYLLELKADLEQLKK
jgi:hypothetical protein